MPQRREGRAAYCLRGEIGGIEQLYHLRPGENRLGSLADNTIELPANGVSRFHAKLTVVDGELEIEDLKSKNGTFVAGQRVETIRVSPGEVVRFGPVPLVFQEYDRDDAELAITFEPAVADQTGTMPILQASTLSSAAHVHHWLRLAEAFHARLFTKLEGDLGAALGLLVDELELSGGCVLEIPDDGYPIVLAASGQVDSTATDELQQLMAAVSGRRHDIYFKSTSGSEPPMTLAVFTSPGTDPLALALWGDYGGRGQSELLLRLLVRMLVPCRPRVESSGEEMWPRKFPGLVFPADYVHAQSAAMGKIHGLMQSLAQGDLPILISGETGVGKEYLAHILHHSSPRRSGPFVAINCAAIPAELLEAELFGIGEGVATGVSGKVGLLQTASGGSIFLDEIGDMSPDLQAKLLRALQEKEVHPVGRDPVSVDVRVLAATNQDLSRRIEDGSFRSDLYYRLAGYVLEVPPLRERLEDIPALVEHYLRSCAKDLGRPIRGLTVRALRMLCDYPWPGNIRELANEVRRAVYLCPENRTVESSTLSPAIRSYEPSQETPPETTTAVQQQPAAVKLGLDSLNLKELEDQAIEEALRRCGNNQVQAAKLVGISRQSLRRRIERRKMERRVGV